MDSIGSAERGEGGDGGMRSLPGRSIHSPLLLGFRRMSAARDSFSYLLLIAAVASALPPLTVLVASLPGLAATAIHAGPLHLETQQAAAQFLAASQGAALWLILAAMLLGNFFLVRIWASVSSL